MDGEDECPKALGAPVDGHEGEQHQATRGEDGERQEGGRGVGHGLQQAGGRPQGPENLQTHKVFFYIFIFFIESSSGSPLVLLTKYIEMDNMEE